MNTVKRWLAGLLSFAMVFTSAGLSSVGTVATFAKDNAIVVTTMDGTKSYSSTDYDKEKYNSAFDQALIETEFLYSDVFVDLEDPNHHNEIKAPVITLNEDATFDWHDYNHSVNFPLVINLNGHKLKGWERLVGDNVDVCRVVDYNQQAYPTVISFDEHETEPVYNWVYTAGKNPAWYVKSVSYLCKHCGLASNKTVVDKVDIDDAKEFRGKSYYDADENRYKFYERIIDDDGELVDGDLLSVRKADVDVEGWYLSVDPYIVAVNGKNQHDENHLPIVRAVLTKINTGEAKIVQVPVVAATEAEINEAIKTGLYPDIAEGNTAATCEEGGAIVYKATVTDPDGKALNTTYLRDDQATEKLDHVKGAVKGCQVAVKVGTVVDGVRKPFQTALAAKKAGEEYGDDFIEVTGADHEYYCWIWRDIPIGNVDFKAGPVSVTIPDDSLAGYNALKEDGSFSYRVVYECDIAKDPTTHANLYGQAVPVKPLDDAATAAQWDDGDGNYSGCTQWKYPNVEEPYTFTSGDKKTTYKFTVTFGKEEKYEEAYSHVQQSNVEVVPATCMTEGEAVAACAICGDTLGGGLTKDDEGNWVSFGRRIGDQGDPDPQWEYPKNTPVNSWVTYGNVDNNRVRVVHHTRNASGQDRYQAFNNWNDRGRVNPDDGSVTLYLGYGSIITIKAGALTTPKLKHNATAQYPDFDKDNPATYPDIEDVTGVKGDTRKVVMSADGKTATVEPDCTHDGGTYGYCKGVPADAGLTGHWVQLTKKDAKKHTFVTETSKVTWKAWEIKADGSRTEIDGDDAFAFNDEHDYTCLAEVYCTTCKTTEYFVYHYMDGVDEEGTINRDGTELTVKHVYNAIDVTDELEGADCQTMAKTIYSVKELTYPGDKKVTKEYDKYLTPHAHKYNVTSWNWSDDYESATITGNCTVEGCNATEAHPGSAIAAVTQTTAKDGITTFTATYGDQTDVKKAYTLKNAVVTFDASKVKDANLVAGIEDYTSPKEEGPEVTVTINGTVIDSSLYDVEWGVYGNKSSSEILKTACMLTATVTWAEDVKKSDIEVLYDYAYGEDEAVRGNEFKPDGKVYETKNGKTEKIKNQTFTYDPEKSYSVVYADKKLKDLEGVTVKYAVTDKAVNAYKSEKQEDPWVVQKKIEALDYNLDAVEGLKDAGEYYVYAQVSKDGYTTFTGLIETVIIVPEEVDVEIDNVTVIEGTTPEFTLETKIDGEVVVIDPSEYIFKTLGGGELTNLTPGTYKIQMVSNNYVFSNDKYSDYVFVLDVISMDDSTEVDQAKAKAVEDQILALSDNPTEAEVAGARAAYDKLPESAKARISADALKKLTDAEEAIQAVKDADAAIAAAKGYETDAAVKAAIDALTEALNKRDTAAIKTATTNLTNAINQAKDAKAAVDAANAAIAAANAYASDANIKALIDALNAAIAKGDTAAIKAATTKLNDAVAAKKAAPAPVVKKAPKITFKTKSPKKIKASKLKKKAQTFKIKASADSKGTITYKKAKGSSKKVKISKKGKVTVKKGTKKGTYKLKVKATAAAKDNFKSGSKTKTYKIVVK